MAYAAVMLVGLGLLVWLVIATRYYYFENASGAHYRDDGWTGIREVLQCADEHRDGQVVRACRWVKG